MSEIENLRDWNARYLNQETPWTAHHLLTDALTLMQKYCTAPAAIAEIGCGFGQEAIALAKLGYQVSAFDLAEAAITIAQQNAQQAGVAVNFQVMNVMQENKLPVFDLVFDIAVLHNFSTLNFRQQFVTAMAKMTKSNAYWLNISCVSPDVQTVEAQTGIKAPPALSREELAIAVDNQFALQEQQLTYYHINREGQSAKFPALISLFKKKSHKKTSG